VQPTDLAAVPVAADLLPLRKPVPPAGLGLALAPLLGLVAHLERGTGIGLPRSSTATIVRYAVLV
jgi:hypothetical protein